MSDQKFLGVCVVAAAIILGAAICYHAQAQRYQMVATPNIYVQDTMTGDTYQGWKNLKK